MRVLALAMLALLAGCLELQGSSPLPPASTSGGAGAGGMSPPPEGALRVMSWNIESFPLTEETPERVAAIIEAHAPDLLAIQEIRDPVAFAALGERLADYVAVIDDDLGNFFRMGFLYRPERLVLSDPVRLFPDDAWAFPRSPLTATVTTAGFDFVVVSLHLKAQIDEQSRERRALAIEKLAAWLDTRLTEDEEQDYLVVGDFNDALTDAPALNVFGPLLSDPRHHFLTLPLEQEGGFTYIPFEAFIDHAMITGDALDEYGAGQTQIFALEEILLGYREHVSDHRPVVVDFAL